MKEAMDLQAGCFPKRAPDAPVRSSRAKTALDKGMKGGPCRSPLLPVSEEVRKEIMSILDRSVSTNTRPGEDNFI